MGPKILLVADSKVAIAELAKALNGYELCAALTGQQAIKLALARSPNLVMVDLPGTLGSETFQLLRSDPATADLPLIFVSSGLEDPALIDALPSGAIDLIGKPINAALARLRVRNILESRRRESRIKDLIEAIPGAIAIVGSDGRASYAKRRSGCPSCWMGLARGSPLETLAPPHARQALLAAAAAIAKGAPSASCAFDEGEGPSRKHWEISAAPLGDGSSELLLVANDQTSRRKSDRAKRREALTDALTQLPNVRALEIRLAELDAEGPASGWRALLFIDMDRFKALNDTHGHPAGDLMLQQVAARLDSCRGQGDLVARKGGDEFVFVLRNLLGDAKSAQAAAMAKAEVVRGRLADAYPVCKGGFVSAASVGVALLEPGKPGAKECLARADDALYEAKRAGKNRCVGDWQTAAPCAAAAPAHGRT